MTTPLNDEQRAMVAQWIPLVCRLTKCAPHANAEDLTQHALLMACERTKTYKPSKGAPGYWLGWSARDARSRLVAQMRRDEKLVHIDGVDLFMPDPDQPEPAEELQAAESVDRVRAALMRLTERQQAVLFLLFWCGLTALSASKLLGLSKNSIQSIKTKALAQLAVELQRRGAA